MQRRIEVARPYSRLGDSPVFATVPYLYTQADLADLSGYTKGEINQKAARLQIVPCGRTFGGQLLYSEEVAATLISNHDERRPVGMDLLARRQEWRKALARIEEVGPDPRA